MFNKIGSLFLSLTIIAVLLFSAIGTTTVYADGGKGGGGDHSDEEATDSQSERRSKKHSVLESVPNNATVTVLNVNGKPLPLATQESMHAIDTASDPIWCPAGQSPTPGANGCTVTFASFDALLAELAGNALYQGAGIIYVQQGAYNGGESIIDFNAYDLSNISNSDLTVQGGWNTITNTVDPNSTSTFNISLVIGSNSNPWGGSLTINNIDIANSNQTALTLYSQNNINLTNIQASASSTGSGAELNAGGDVNINDSLFERNRDSGAIISAGGNVSIANSSFSNPGTNRLQLTGLDVNSGGNVALFDVIANGNREVGANIVADGRVSIGSSFIGGSSFSGTKSTTTTTCPGSPSQFCGFGLQVTTPDSIDLQGVVGNDNFLWGANLNAGQNVNIVDSIFNANSTEVPTFIDDTGLFVTAGGNVSLNNVTANDNRLYGASIDAVGNVSINNSNFLSNNGVTVSGSGATQYDGIGLLITSDSSIFLNGVNASGNTLFGANLNAAGDVAISNSIFSNTTTGSAIDALGVGLQIVSGQNVFIDTVTLDGNQLSGANIQAAGDAFLDFITATNNGTNGMEVDAHCTLLNGGAFTGNGQYGLSLVNPTLDQTGTTVFSGNGLGDIFPANPGACPVAITGGGNTDEEIVVIHGNGTNTTSTSNQAQSGTLSAITNNSFANFMSKGSGMINSGVTLNSLFMGNYQLFGVSTSLLPGNVTALSIFTGKYAYIHSPYGLKIVLLLQPAIFTNVWSSDAS